MSLGKIMVSYYTILLSTTVMGWSISIGFCVSFVASSTMHDWTAKISKQNEKQDSYANSSSTCLVYESFEILKLLIKKKTFSVSN